VPSKVDALSDDCGPYFPYYFIQTEGAHILEGWVTSNLGRKLENFVFEPSRSIK
jgi:hypothetical protein